MKSSVPNQQIRTTIYLEETLYFEAKKKALEKRTTLTDLIKKGLRKEIGSMLSQSDEPNDILSLAKLRLKGGPKDLSSKFSTYLYGK